MNIRKRDRLPPEPPERNETVRREILLELKQQSLTAKELSSAVGIPEKEVYEHLEHIRKTAGSQPYLFIIISSLHALP
jgi:predicted Zn-ribbon and HTH transcriptional regulator